MPSWNLRCKDCDFNFPHSVIDDESFANYFTPLKPELPDRGMEMDCPRCGCKNTYERFDLAYQA